MNKTKLFLDFDSTICHSIKSYCETYNDIYRIRKDFVPAKWFAVDRYDLKDQCPLVVNPNDIFSNPLFFDKLKFIDDNTFDVIEKLNKVYDIYICTIGVPKNLSLKVLWLENNLPFINNYILLSNGKTKCTMNKSIVDMKDSIFIDDVSSNLESSNAKHKFIFGEEYSWNENCTEIRLFNWNDVELKLLH